MRSPMKRSYKVLLYWVMIIERVLDVKLRTIMCYGANGSLIDLISNLYELRIEELS